MYLSLLPIDVGFDLRKLGVPVLLNHDYYREVLAPLDENGLSKVVLSGPRDEVARRLERLGFVVTTDPEGGQQDDNCHTA